jgi:hypothetical protein
MKRRMNETRPPRYDANLTVKERTTASRERRRERADSESPPPFVGMGMLSGPLLFPPKEE